MKPASPLQLVLFATTLSSLLLWVGKLFIPSMALLYLFFKIGLVGFADPAQLRGLLCMGIGLWCAVWVHRKGWPLPHAVVLTLLLLSTFALHGYVVYRKAHRRQDIQANIRKSLESRLQPYPNQAMLDWNQIQVETCGTTLMPKGLLVVTSHGFQAIPWQLFRQAQAMYGRPLFAFEIEKRWLNAQIPAEPAMDAAYWQMVLEKIQGQGLLHSIPKSSGTDRLVLIRNIGDPLPTLAQSFPFPAPGGVKYTGLPLATLQSLNCANGVTVCREGVVVRDVCGLQSVAWSEVETITSREGAGGSLDCRIVCANQKFVLDPLTSSEHLTLQPADREAMQKQLISILGLKAEMDKYHSTVYVRTGAALNPPASPTLYPGYLTKQH